MRQCFFRPLLMAGFVFLDQFCEGGVKKFQPFSKCFRPKNSPLLSGVVIFPEWRGVFGPEWQTTIFYYKTKPNL